MACSVMLARLLAIFTMAALFPPWANTATHLVLGALAVVAVGALAAPMVCVRSPYATGAADPVMQPIPFDHRHHVRDDGIDCLYCHEAAERSAFAGVPATERCMGCHNQIWNDSDLIAPLRASVETGQPIRWQRVHSLPDFVYFDHAIHVTRGIGCVTCHGRVDEMAAVYQVHRLTMSWCLDCHRDPASQLRPRDRITSMTWTADGPDELAGLARYYRPRSLTHCSTCHR
jgi:Cytochrome c7 and related cytochrome c